MREFEMIYRDEVSSKAVTIYRYLHDRQGKHENCFPSHRTIALDNKCSVSTVKRAIDELVKKGYVTKTRSEKDARIAIIELTAAGRKMNRLHRFSTSR